MLRFFLIVLLKLFGDGGPHVGQPWLTACYTSTKIVCRDWYYTTQRERERTKKDGGEKYRAKNSVKSWSMNWQLFRVKTFLQSASELMRGSIFFHGVPKRKMKTGGEFVMLGRNVRCWEPVSSRFFMSLFGNAPDRLCSRCEWC